MDETFDVFLHGIEKKTQKEEISKLLRSKAEPTRQQSLKNKGNATRLTGAAPPPPDAGRSKTLLNRAYKNMKETEKIGRDHKIGVSSLREYSQKVPSGRQAVDKMIERGKRFTSSDLNVAILSSVFPEKIAGSRELTADIRKKNELAANTFDMSALCVELSKISDRKQNKTDLSVERDAQRALLEDLRRDNETRQAELDGVNVETEKLLAQLAQVNAAVAEANLKAKESSDAVITAIQKKELTEKQLADFEARDKERMSRLALAKKELEKATAKKTAYDQKIEKAQTKARQEQLRFKEQCAQMEQALNNTRKKYEEDLVALKTQRETLSAELAGFQQELERSSEMKRASIEEAVAEDAFAAEMAEMDQQTDALKNAILKADKAETSARLAKEAAVDAKNKEIETAQGVLADKESTLQVVSGELQRRVLELTHTRDALVNAIRSMNVSAVTAEAKYKRLQKQKAKDRKQGRAPSRKVQIRLSKRERDASRESKHILSKESRRILSKDSRKSNVSARSMDVDARNNVQYLASGDNAVVPPPAKKSQLSQANTEPTSSQQAANLGLDPDDSLCAGSDGDEDAGGADVDFDLSFASYHHPVPKTNVAPSPKVAATPVRQETATITFDASQCVTSTPISNKRNARARVEAASTTPQKRARRGRGKK